jgi:NADH-quinone oxidoreductase subunit L
MAIGLFILFKELGTLNIQQILTLAPQHWQMGDQMVVLATLMLLGGAVGKSAQLPLQTWLADAMAGPTPVSALIHAATMVTAGVYLIARTHGLFLLAPDVLELVGIVGAVTLVLAGFSALVQTDIKRILAYSTMSQIGYMFLALGVGAWQASMFHLMTHAFFKALLFLSAGAVIIACHHEQNIFKMGGLYKKIPFVYACFLVGGGALAAFPF